tara:strand:+ start:2655 stop:2888 length:234 start_codon:yes stop_codon:yes gene_type:complete
MEEYWTTVVEFDAVAAGNGNGKSKKRKENYLVLADSASYAEAQVSSLLQGSGQTDFRVCSAVRSKITEVKTTELKDI